MFKIVFKKLIFSMIHFNNVSTTKTTMIQRKTLCKTSIQNFKIKKHVELFCIRRKIFDDMKFQKSKIVKKLMTNELCNEHKKIKKKFMHIIIFQLELSDHVFEINVINIVVIDIANIYNSNEKFKCRFNLSNIEIVNLNHFVNCSNDRFKRKFNLLNVDVVNFNHVNEHSNVCFKREFNLLNVDVNNTDNFKALFLIKRCDVLIIIHNKSIAIENFLKNIVDKTIKIQNLTQKM